MQYPLLSEYKESILNAEDNFDKLSYLRPVLDVDGEPVMSSGNFAVVFKMTDGKKDYAVKCFTKEQEGRSEAYQLIAEELESVNSLYITSIKYLEKELFVDCNCEENEFPILLMDWIEGESMEKFIADNYQDSYAMSMLCCRFCKMAAWLRSQPFAHGDLKPDNIIIRPDGDLALVDYDGMFVPAMKGQKSPTIGTKNFSHPLRTIDDFDENIDDLALASIALSLKAISLNPSLYSEYCMADRLLFSSDDYLDLSKSKVLTDVQSLLTDKEIAKLFSLLLLSLSMKDLSLCSFRLFDVKKPSACEHIKTWSLVSFAKEFGKKVQLGNNKSEDSIQSLRFTNQNGMCTYVSIPAEMGKLTTKDVVSLQDELIVVETNSENYSLRKRINEKNDNLKGQKNPEILFSLIRKCASKLLFSLKLCETEENVNLILNELTILTTASILSKKTDEFTDFLKAKIYCDYLSLTEIKDYDQWIESNTPSMYLNDTVEDAISLAEFEKKNGTIKFFTGKINAYPYDDSFWGEFSDKGGKKHIIYVEQGFPREYNTSAILENKYGFGIVEGEDTYYGSEDTVYCLKEIKKRHSMLPPYIGDRLSFYSEIIKENTLNRGKEKLFSFLLYNAVINEMFNDIAPYLDINGLVFGDDKVIDEIGELHNYDSISFNKFSSCVWDSLNYLRKEVNRLM